MPSNLVDELENLRTALASQPLDAERIERIIETISAIDTEYFPPNSFGSFFYSTWKQIAAAHRNSKPYFIEPSILRAATHLAAEVSNAPYDLRTALDYLFLWTEVGQYLREHKLEPLRYVDLLANDHHVSALEERLATCRPELSTDYGYFMLQGLLCSISNREDAAHAFRQARSDNPEFAEKQLLDVFLGTYLSDSLVVAKASKISARRSELQSGFEFLVGQLPTDDESTVLLFSCDPAYFGLFFQYWASASVFLREQGIHMHFVLVGNHSDVSTSLRHGLELVTSIARLRGLTSRALLGGLSFSALAVPADVGELRTLYACARFLVARDLLDKTPAQMLVVDIDTEVHSDPRVELQELAKIASTQVPLVAQRGLLTLIPAYRFPAYRIVLPLRSIAADALVDVENYIYAALSRSPSWLLDQSALDYAVGRLASRHGVSLLAEVNHHLAPFQQRPIGRMFKDMHRPT